MSIDIRDLNSSRQLPGQRTAPDPAGAAAGSGSGKARANAAAGEAVNSGDKVALSPTAQSLKSLESAVSAGDGVDTARVERIRAQIAEGRYHVDADKLADRMIDLERTLLG